MPLATILRGLARGTTFTPSSISGLVGWFDATQIRPSSVDPSLLSGGAPAAWFKADDISGNDGDPISSWSDASAGGHSLTAATTARPTLKKSILNGHAISRFNGTSHTLTGDSGLATLFAGGASCSVFVVSMTNVQTTIQVILNWNVTGGTGGYSITQGYDDVGARHYHIGRRLAADTIQETVGPTNANGQYRAFYASDNPAAASGLSSYFDGTIWATTSHASNGVFGTGSGSFRLGSTSIPDQFLNGDVAEIIVFTRVLSTLERRQIDRYLSDKYALAGVPSSDGDIITDWVDLSGQLNHVRVSVGGAPVFKVAVQNGKNVVRFASASSQYVKTPVAPTTINDPCTVFVVGARSSTAAAHTYFDGGGTAGFIRGTTATPKYRIWNGTATGTSDTSWHQISAVANGASDALYVDGATVIAASAQGAPAITAFTIGGDSAGGNYFQGDISEVLIYNLALSDPNRQLVEAYLKAKWGTP